MSGNKKIFICYRQKVGDSETADRLYDTLSKKFGSGNVFKDETSIKLGEPLPERIGTAIQNCNVFIILIGKNWREGTKTINGKSVTYSIKDENDWIRNEIVYAASLNKTIIPLRIDESADNLYDRTYTLPKELQFLTTIKSDLLLKGSKFHWSISELVNDINGTDKPNDKKYIWIASLIFIFLTSLLVVIKFTSVGSEVSDPPLEPKNWLHSVVEDTSVKVGAQGINNNFPGTNAVNNSENKIEETDSGNNSESTPETIEPTKNNSEYNSTNSKLASKYSLNRFIGIESNDYMVAVVDENGKIDQALSNYILKSLISLGIKGVLNVIDEKFYSDGCTENVLNSSKQISYYLGGNIPFNLLFGQYSTEYLKSDIQSNYIIANTTFKIGTINKNNFVLDNFEEFSNVKPDINQKLAQTSTLEDLKADISKFLSALALK